jgi:hypothetical protein
MPCSLAATPSQQGYYRFLLRESGADWRRQVAAVHGGIDRHDRYNLGGNAGCGGPRLEDTAVAVIRGLAWFKGRNGRADLPAVETLAAAAAAEIAARKASARRELLKSRA